MKLFIWEGVLTDYTSGMVVVIAKNVDEARLVGANGSKWIAEEISCGPEVVDLKSPMAQRWIVYGGG